MFSEIIVESEKMALCTVCAYKPKGLFRRKWYSQTSCGVKTSKMAFIFEVKDSFISNVTSSRVDH